MKFSNSLSTLVPLFVGAGHAVYLETRDAQSQDLLRVGPSIVEVSPRFRNVLPVANFNRNFTVKWWETSFLDGSRNESVEEAFEAIKNTDFITFDKEFYELLGVESYNDDKTLERIFEFPPGPSFSNRLVHDGTVYSPECNCIFFVEMHPPKEGFSADAMPWIWRTSLNSTKPVTEKVYPTPQLTMGNGAYYHNGSVYFAQEGNHTTPGGIVRMDPMTLKTEVVLNNFLGHRFNSPNDIVITKSGIAFFTDGYYGYATFNSTIKPEVANGVWRWDMTTGDLRHIVGAGTGIFLNPNGVALSASDEKLYVTARGETSAAFDGQRTVYEFDIIPPGTSGLAVQYKGIHSFADSGFPDGIKIDAQGRVFTGVKGGVDIWSSSGSLLGKIKVAEGDDAVNIQFVDDWLYIMARTYIYRVQLSTRGIQQY